MRPNLQEIEIIERFLFHRLSAEEQAEFHLRRLTDPEFAEQVDRQQEAHRLIRAYGRRQVQRELQALHRRMMARPSFRRRILAIFRPS